MLQQELMLHGETCDPEIVGGDRRSRPAQLRKEAGIDFRGFAIRKEEFDFRLPHELGEQAFVHRGPRRQQKPCFDLSDHNEGGSTPLRRAPAPRPSPDRREARR